MLTAHAYDLHVDQLFARLRQFHNALDDAGIPYRIVGGLAIFIHIYAQDVNKARTTKDIDAAVDRADLPRIIEAAKKAGLQYRHAAGVDMLVEAGAPSARTAVHLVFLREKVRPEYLEAIPDSQPVRTSDGILLASVADLVRMKLTSFRLKDKVHVQDMDGAGLITPDVEASLSEPLRERLAEVRATR